VTVGKSRPVKPAPKKGPLRLEYRKPSELSSNPANWRRHPQKQLEALADVIAEVGWAGVLLYNERTKRLVDGHARKQIASASDEPVPVVIGSWSEEQERTILATLDPLAAMAVADSAALASLLAGVVTSSDAVRAMLDDLAHANAAQTGWGGRGGDNFDATPAASGPWRTKPGELWLIGGKHRLLVGDCTLPEAVSRLFAGRVPALMVTDPPYGVKYDPTWRHRLGITTSSRTGAVTNDDRADWSAAWRLFPGNVAYVYHGALHGPTVFESLAAAGFLVRAQLVWLKPRLVLNRGHFHWKHEPLFHAERPDDADPEPPVEAELAYYGVRKGARADWRGGRKQTTVCEIGFTGETQTHRGTQKPVECMARPIRNHGAAGDAVYDPFLGSGTTLIAAHRVGRVCYGCEIEPRYADVILKRAEAEGLECARAEEEAPTETRPEAEAGPSADPRVEPRRRGSGRVTR
jgi:DNA modification methylase